LFGAGFFCYAYNIVGARVWMDRRFLWFDSSLRRPSLAWYRFSVHLMSILAAVLALMVLWMLLHLAAAAYRDASKAARLAIREPMSVRDFIQLAASHRISMPVAREAYRLLEPYYGEEMRVRLSDNVGRVLHLNQTERANLLSSLLRDADRLSISEPEFADAETVLELLQSAENSAPRIIG